MSTAPARASNVAAAVIGGSAGAIEVVRALLAALPAKISVPVVIVIHLPERSSHRLADLLSFGSAVPVKQAEDKEPIRAGQVYVAPAAYHLLVEPTLTLALSLDAPVHYSRPAIDVLFESARDAYGAGLLGILLSGASEDGAAGLQEVHAAGGITIVQEPASAEVTIMPRAALARFQPTHTWSPAQISAGLPHLLVHAPLPTECRSPP
jgi:two-component system, chemotaxis family, protein-glutamate methylesterase/glutaminase